MSQVKFTAPMGARDVEVMGGWDRPLKEFFLTVFETDDEDTVIWSAMHDPMSQDKLNTDRLRTQLTKMGIEAPKGFWDKVELRESNVVYKFQYGDWERFLPAGECHETLHLVWTAQRVLRGRARPRGPCVLGRVRG